MTAAYAFREADREWDRLRDCLETADFHTPVPLRDSWTAIVREQGTEIFRVQVRYLGTTLVQPIVLPDGTTVSREYPLQWIDTRMREVWYGTGRIV